MSSVQFPLHAALAARDALASQAQLMRVRATIDRRWQCEVARLEAAHVALSSALDTALAGAEEPGR